MGARARDGVKVGLWARVRIGARARVRVRVRVGLGLGARLVEARTC